MLIKRQMAVRIMAVIITVAMLAALSGCSNVGIYYEYRRVEDLELIRTIGVDVEENKNGNVTVTACSGIDLKGAKARIISRTASTMATALDIMQENIAGKEPFYAHADHIVIGENAAKEGIAGYLDFIMRATEMRTNINLFIVKGGTAKDLITETEGEVTSAANMLLALNENLSKIGRGFMVSCRELSANLSEFGYSLALAVKLTDTDEIDEESGRKMIIPAGFALIQDGKLIDYIDEDLGHSVGTIMGESMLGDTVADDGMGGNVVLSYDSVETKIKPRFSDGELKTVDITISCRLNVEEVTNEINLRDSEVRKNIALQVAKAEADNAKKAITLSQNMGIDFMNIGGDIQLMHPVKFEKMAHSWDELFSDMEFNITAEATLIRTYDINNPLNVSGKD